jgi:hypothetical protein
LNYSKLQRVNRLFQCPICHKSDWCLAAPDGSIAICPRISKGAIKRCGNAGWLHRLHKQSHSSYWSECSIEESPNPYFTRLMDYIRSATAYNRIIELAALLNVDSQSLFRLDVGWWRQSWIFPLKDAEGKITGIQRRFRNGLKRMMKSSKMGLFIPQKIQEDPLLICEGASDCATALSMGFSAIGRPSCNTGAKHIYSFAQGRETVIIADNDEVGINGAKHLASNLVLYCPSVKIVLPPPGIKDLREWVKVGLIPKELWRHIKGTAKVNLKFVLKEGVEK